MQFGFRFKILLFSTNVRFSTKTLATQIGNNNKIGNNNNNRTTYARPSRQSDKATLRELLPSASEEDLDNALLELGGLHSAADALLEGDSLPEKFQYSTM